MLLQQEPSENRSLKGIYILLKYSQLESRGQGAEGTGYLLNEPKWNVVVKCSTNQRLEKIKNLFLLPSLQLQLSLCKQLTTCRIMALRLASMIL